MEISVIIPTYKPKDYIWKCLDSIVNQTFSRKKFEVILVLNGCCEPWKSAIENYLADKMANMHINFIQVDNGGVSNARNIALDVAKGKYITFIDDDDYVSPQYLEELYKIASLDAVSISYTLAFDDLNPTKNYPFYITKAYNACHNKKNNRVSSMVRKYFNGPCMKLIPKTLIENSRFDKRFKNGEDSLFMFLISNKIKNIVFTSNEAVYYRRFRENSAVTSKRSLFKRIQNAIKLICAYSEIYFQNVFDYSLIFYLNRILAIIKGVLIR